MLYPIELLRHKTGSGRRAVEGVHVNQQQAVCHASDRAFCLPSGVGIDLGSCILQYSKKPSLQDARQWLSNIYISV